VSNVKSTLLIVDDSEITLDILKYILSPDYNILTATDGSRALEVAARQLPDLIILDILMPGLSGYEVCKKIRENLLTEHIPVIFCTSLDTDIDEEYGFEVGGDDFIVKPFSAPILKKRVETHLRLANSNKALKVLVTDKTIELETNKVDLINSLVLATEIKDKQVSEHLDKVGRYTKLLAKKVGFTDDKCNLIELASRMHDIGKIGIPDKLLQKPGLFTAKERVEIQKHCLNGSKIIKGHKGELFKVARVIVEQHHELWNGNGYPNGLKGDQIDLIARLVTVSDVFDALTSARTYKKTWSFEDAYKYINDNTDMIFDPAVVLIFKDLKEEFMEVYNT